MSEVLDGGHRSSREAVSQHLGHRLNTHAEFVGDLREREAVGTGFAERFPPDGGKASDDLTGEGGERLRDTRRR